MNQSFAGSACGGISFSYLNEEHSVSPTLCQVQLFTELEIRYPIKMNF